MRLRVLLLAVTLVAGTGLWWWRRRRRRPRPAQGHARPAHSKPRAAPRRRSRRSSARKSRTRRRARRSATSSGLSVRSRESTSRPPVRLAPLGLVPEVPVQGTVTKPPEPGTYLSHVKGTYDLQRAGLVERRLLPRRRHGDRQRDGRRQHRPDHRSVPHDLLRRDRAQHPLEHDDALREHHAATSRALRCATLPTRWRRSS